MTQGFDFSKPKFLDPLESESVRTNFKALGTNHEGPTAPSDPELGMTWLDTSDPANVRLRMYVNGVFIVILNNLAGGAPSQSAVDLVVHTQVNPSTTWAVIHNIGTRDVVVQVWDENDQLMLPDTASVIDPDQLLVTFLNPQAGKALVLG